MHRRPFRVVPQIAHTAPLGWAYLRWGRGTRRVPSLDHRPRRRRPVRARLTHRASAAVIALLSLVLWAGILAAVP